MIASALRRSIARLPRNAKNTIAITSSRAESAIATPMPAPPGPIARVTGTMRRMKAGRSASPTKEMIVIVHDRSRIISAIQRSTLK